MLAGGSDVNVEFHYTAWPEVPESLVESGYSRGTPAELAHAEITKVRPINLTMEVSTRLVYVPITADTVSLYREWIDSLLAADERLEASILDRCLEDAQTEDDTR